MPKIYKRHCNVCGKYYEKPSKKFCSYKCVVLKMKGHIGYNRLKLSDGSWYPSIPSICFCGCGEIVYGGKKYILGHNSKGKNNPMHGKEPWCKGLTKENNKIIKDKSDKTSKALFGKKMTEERRIKHAERIKLHPSMLGKHHTELTKQKQRESKIGIKNHRYGKPSPIGAGYCKRYYYESENHGLICFKGSYEYKYVLYLDKNNIKWIYQPKTFILSDEMTYTPDFYLPSETKFIEIKGYLYPIHKIKINKFLKEYSNLKLEVLYKQDLQNLGIDMNIKLDQNLYLRKNKQ